MNDEAGVGRDMSCRHCAPETMGTPKLLRASLVDLQTARTSTPALSYASQSPNPMPRFAPVMTTSPSSCGMHAVQQYTACPCSVKRDKPATPASRIDVLTCELTARPKVQLC